MKRFTTVASFFESYDSYKEELSTLRSIVLDTGLQETLKWGAPVYTYNSKNIVGIGAFKTYVGLWFFNGALLADTANVLINAQENKTVAMRQFRFANVEEISKNRQLIKAYIYEAIENEKQGKTVIFKKKPLKIPELLKAAFLEDELLEQAFADLKLTQKREFTEYIETAKRETTKQNRLEKIIPMIKKGVGLNDKYR